MSILKSAQCAKKLSEARDKLRDALDSLPRHLKNNVTADLPFGWGSPRRFTKAQRKTVGRAVARAIALHGDRHFKPNARDYEIMDAALGVKVRASKLPAHATYLNYILRTFAGGRLDRYDYNSPVESPKNMGFAGCKPWFPPHDVHTPIIRACHLKADVEYWEELLRLATERESARQLRLPLRSTKLELAA